MCGHSSTHRAGSQDDEAFERRPPEDSYPNLRLDANVKLQRAQAQ
jgi:hypothetical protein